MLTRSCNLPWLRIIGFIPHLTCASSRAGWVQNRSYSHAVVDVTSDDRINTCFLIKRHRVVAPLLILVRNYGREVPEIHTSCLEFLICWRNLLPWWRCNYFFFWKTCEEKRIELQELPSQCYSMKSKKLVIYSSKTTFTRSYYFIEFCYYLIDHKKS